jgi:hypothetical protein
LDTDCGPRGHDRQLGSGGRALSDCTRPARPVEHDARCANAMAAQTDRPTRYWVVPSTLA